METEAALRPHNRGYKHLLISEVSNNTNKQMFVAEEASQPERRLPEDEETNECDPGDQKDENMRITYSLKDKRFIKDVSQFKEEMLKVFREKDLSENKPALDLLKDDLSQFKEDVTSVFSSSKETKSTGPKPSQTAEKTNNRRSFLNFKDDLSSVLSRIGPSKERDGKKNSSNNFKKKAERTEDKFLQSLFRREQKTSQKAENSQEVKETFSETSEEETDAGFRVNLSEQNEETDDTQKIIRDMMDRMKEVEDSEEDITVSDETRRLSEAAKQRRETVKESYGSSELSEDERINEEEIDNDKEQEEDKPPETLLWKPLSSGINLFSLTDLDRDDMRGQPGGDLWSVKNFACYLTLDPSTANSELRLTDCNRKATRVWSDRQAPDHPDRFEHCPQVLCREGLLDSVYWEVVWSGGADIGVTYNSISRDGDVASCLLGHNDRSWSLECSEGSYTPCHQNKRFRSSSPRPFTHRVGVYLNWSAGSLSFYCVSQDTMVHLHTFTSNFTEPLYPGFWVWAYKGSVLLSQVALDWERLLQ